MEEEQAATKPDFITPVYEPFEYSPAQRDIFFDGAHKGRYRIHPKGRRLGATQGAAHAFIEMALWGHPLLWGDVTQDNLVKYVERYFIPPMRKRKISFKWNKQSKVLKIGENGGYIDFRSKERPENWEGFAYKVIFINEAGLVLEEEYLYYNAVLPMLMDHADSQLIAAGTPKGRNLFYDLWQKAVEGQKGYYTQTYTTWDNPWMGREQIQEFIDSVPPEAVAQEVYGEFTDLEESEWRVIPREWIRIAQERWKATIVPLGHPDALGVDPARGGKDKTVLASRWGEYIGQIQAYPGKSTVDGPAVVKLAVAASSPETQINVDVIGIGSSVYDHLKSQRSNVSAVNGSTRSISLDKTKQYKFRNLRSQMFWQMRERLDPSSTFKVALPPDSEMMEDLAALTYKIVSGTICVDSKDEIKEEIGRSPDKGDAVVYAFFEAKPKFEQVILKKPRGWYG